MTHTTTETAPPGAALTDTTMNQDQTITEIMTRAQSDEGAMLAARAITEYANTAQELNQHDIMRVLKVSYIAARFFGRSRAWLCNKLNGNALNGKPGTLTAAERATLKAALDTIAQEIQDISDSM